MAVISSITRAMKLLLCLNILSPCLALAVPEDTVTLNGKLNDVKVGFVNDNLECLCRVNGVSLPINDIQWKTNRKIIDNSNEPSYGYSVRTKLITIEQYFMIERLSEDMDGTTVTCSYSQPLLVNGISSWNIWAAKAELVLLTMTIDASKEACDTGVGDLFIRFKEVGKKRSGNLQIENKIRSKIEEITGSMKIKYHNSSYFVILPFNNVINNQNIFDMDPELMIDGNPTASCLNFKQARQMNGKDSMKDAPMISAVVGSKVVFAGMYIILFSLLGMVVTMFFRMKKRCNVCRGEIGLGN